MRIFCQEEYVWGTLVFLCKKRPTVEGSESLTCCLNLHKHLCANPESLENGALC